MTRKILMKFDVNRYPDFKEAIENNKLVYVFGAGISAALSGKIYSWIHWLKDGIACIKNKEEAGQLMGLLNETPDVTGMVTIAGRIIEEVKRCGTYDEWMHASFECCDIVNHELADTLKKLSITQDIFATTNYDKMLEYAVGMTSLSFHDSGQAFSMLDNDLSTHVLHLHGLYDSEHGIDNIVASEEQYHELLSNEGAQFIQNILSTRTIVFIGCGKTTDDVNISRLIDFAVHHLKLDRTYYFLHVGKKYDGYLPENIVPISYGEEYGDLNDFLESVALCRLERKAESSPIVDKTIFSKSRYGSFGLDEYYYANEKLKFCGRKNELAQLFSFLEFSKEVSWWAVTGQAGSGKSRLAFEFLHRLPVPWFGFFINKNASEKYFEEFVPFTHTLIVVDYVEGNEEKTATVINLLANRFESTKYKLRILLLERDNLLLTGSWFNELLGCMDSSFRSKFLESEYNYNYFSNSHNFVYLEDLDYDAVLELISSVCSQAGLPADTHRDINLKDEYERKLEKLRFRPLFLELFIETWINNGFIEIDYKDYTELLEKVIKREQSRILEYLGNDIGIADSVIRLIVRAGISDGLKIAAIPEVYKDDWEKIKSYVRNHSFSGVQKNDCLLSILKYAGQEIGNEDMIIKPMYPDIIKEYMFLFYFDEERLTQVIDELWLNAPAEFSAFLSRAEHDFHGNVVLHNIIRISSEKNRSLYSLEARFSILQKKVLHKSDDIRQVYNEIDEEYDFWDSIEITKKTSLEIKKTKLKGLYFCAYQYLLGFGSGKCFDVISKIAKFPEKNLTEEKIQYLFEFLHYLAEKNSYDVAEKLFKQIKPLLNLADKQDKKKFDLILKREQLMVFITKGESEKAEYLCKEVEDKYWNNKNHEIIELFAYFFFSGALKSLYRCNLNCCMLCYEVLQDYMVKCSDDNYYVSDKTHYYYLHSKLIYQELALPLKVKLGSEVKRFMLSSIDSLLSEVERNEMYPELSSILVGVYVLKTEFDDSLKASEIETYLTRTDAFLKKYPGNRLLAEKSLELWNKYFERKNAKPSEDFINDAYILVMRFSDSIEVIRQFEDLISLSDLDFEKKAVYVNRKNILSTIISNKDCDYETYHETRRRMCEYNVFVGK